MINNERSTIGFASRMLKQAETRYTTTKLKALAILYCCMKFRQYLIGHKIIIQTDHHALTFIKQCKLTSGRLTRWALALQEFDFKIEHIPEKENRAADTLTRYPRIGENRMDNKICINKIEPILVKELINLLNNISTEQIKDEHKNKMHKNKSKHTTTKIGVIFVRQNEEEHWRLVILQQIASIVIRETHEKMGHPGRYKTCHILKEFCTFRNMHRSVSEIIKKC